MPAIVEEGVPGIPGYEVLERLGTGGHGAVFRARHPVIGKDVAIKVLHAGTCTDPSAAHRFITEARAVNRIQHPSIVEVFDLQVLDDGRPYIVMELLRGRTLRSVLDERGRLPATDAFRILRSIAEAIDAAHAAGVAHRDLKPENVFVLDDGAVKLIDFGLAKLDSDVSVTVSGATLGTPRYMSPEQCRGRASDHRSDLYSFGALAYHVLTGRPPFDGDALALALHHLNDAPERPTQRCPELPAQVDDELLALLAKDPARRPSPLAEVVARMSAPRRPRRLRRWWGAGALAGTLAVAAVAASAVSAREVARERRQLTANVERVDHRPDGLPYIPWMSADGSQVMIADRSGTWLLGAIGGVEPLPFVDVDAVDYASQLPDGRWVVTRYAPDRTSTIWIEDLRTGARTQLSAGTFAEACPRGDRVAVIEARELAIHDLRSGERTRVAAVQDVWSVRWSPDCRQLVWVDNSERRVRLAQLGEDRVRDLPLPLLPSAQIAPVAFIDEATLLYCAPGAGGVELRAHALADATAAHDTRLHVEPITVESCGLAVAANGREALAILFSTQPMVATLATAPGSRLRQITGTSSMTATFEDDHRVLVYEGPRLESLDPARELPARQLSAVRIDDATAAPRAVCPGSAVMVRREGRPLHARLTDAGERMHLELLDADACRTVASWQLPAGDRWSEPRCAHATCVIARYAGGHVELWKLPRAGAPELVTRADAPAAVYAPSVAVSPDARHAIVLPRDGTSGPGTVLVVALDGGSTSRFDVLGIQSVVWSADPDHVYISGRGIDGHHNPVLRMSLTGERELVWSSDATWTAVRDLSPRGDVLALDARRFSAELLHVTLRPR